MRTWLLQHKKILFVVLLFLAVVGLSWQFFATKAEQALQDNVMQRINEQLHGKMQAEAIDLSLLGWIKFRGVSLLDSQGNLVAQCTTVRTRYQFSNLLDGNLDLSRIETVIFENAELWLEESNGLNNWNGLVKDNKESTNFRGNLQLITGKVHVKTPLL